MASDAYNRSGDPADPPREGQWKSFQNPHPDLPNPHLPQNPKVSLTREELRVLQDCNKESFWYRSLPACMVCVTGTQLAVAKGYLKPHPKYGAGLKTLGAALLGYILGKISYQNECRQKIMALPNSQLAETLRNRGAAKTIAPPSEFAPENNGGVVLPGSAAQTTDHSDVFDAKPEQPSFEDGNGEPESQFRSYDDIRRQNRQVYYQDQVVKWQNSPNTVRIPPQAPTSSQNPEEDKGSQWIPPPPPSSTRSRGPRNQYGDVWQE